MFVLSHPVWSIVSPEAVDATSETAGCMHHVRNRRRPMNQIGGTDTAPPVLRNQPQQHLSRDEMTSVMPKIKGRPERKNPRGSRRQEGIVSHNMAIGAFA